MQKFVFFIVIVLAAVGVTGLYFQHQKAQARQAEVARQQELARAEAAKLEAERAEREHREAQRRQREEAARAQAAAREQAQKRRQEEKARVEQEKKAAEEQVAAAARDARAEACEKILTTLKGGVLRPWKTVTEEDQPDTAKGDKTFYCVFPDDDGGRMFLELKTTFGRPVSFRRLDSATGTEQYEPTEFRQFASVFPHLLLSGANIYFRSSRADVDPCRVPRAGGSFNPAEQDFGALYETVCTLGLKTDAFVYAVYFRPFGTQTEVPIAKVPFGKTVPATAFHEKVSAWAKRSAATARKKPAARKWKPTVVFADRAQVKKRVDGVTEVPRTFVYNGNKHRYAIGTREYESEVKKEEAARRKWEVLAAEAKRQEAMGQQLAEKKPDANGNGDLLEMGSVVYRLFEEPRRGK